MNDHSTAQPEESNLVEIKETLSELLNVLRERGGDDEAAPADDMVHYIKRLLAIRTGRRRFLPVSYFDGPALTILLDLYVSDREARPVAVSDAVAISGAPTSTALRWIATMEADGYITKQQDPGDKRRTLVHATPRALSEIESLAALWRKTP